MILGGKKSAVSEVAFLPVRPGVDIEDTSTHEGKVMANMLAVGRDLPRVQKNYYGVEIENPTHVHLILDWDSLAAHKDYQAQPEYAEFLAAAHSMVDPENKAVGMHVPFSPHPPSKALLSPVTEIVKAYFSVEQAEGDRDAFEKGFMGLLKALGTEGIDGFTGQYSAGWSIEEVDFEGEKCKIYLAVIGWSTMEAHMEARKTKVFKENAGGLRHGVKALTAVHVKFKSS